MLKGGQFQALYRNLCQMPNPLVNRLVGCKQHPLLILQRYQNSRVSTKDELIRSLTGAIKQKKKGGIIQVLTTFENQEVKPTSPIQLTKEIEKYFLSVYWAKSKTGLAIFRFVCNYGEPNSKLEQTLINQTLENMEKLPAFQLAAFVDCIKYVNTDLRWTLVQTFEHRIQEGLSSSGVTFTDIVNSISNYKDTALEQYLLNQCRRMIKDRKRTNPLSPDLATLFDFLAKSKTKDFELFGRCAHRQMLTKYKQTSISLPNIVTCIFLVLKYEFVNIDYYRFLATHLKFSLDQPFAFEDENTLVSNIVKCLTGFAVAGYRDDEMIKIILNKLEKHQTIITNIQLGLIFCALSVLDVKDLSLVDKWNYKPLLTNPSDKAIADKTLALGICVLLQQNSLNISEVEKLLQLLEEKWKWGLPTSPSLVRAFFTTKAYSELILKTPVSQFIDEETMALRTPEAEALISPVKESVVFVAKLLAGDESLLRCLYLNKYSHFIDVDFYVDDKGTIQPEDFDGPLTRILLIVLNWTDLVICDHKTEELYPSGLNSLSKRRIDYEPRGPMKMLLHHLQLAENAEIITINYYLWNKMNDRHERLKFLESEIQSTLQKKQKKAIS